MTFTANAKVLSQIQSWCDSAEFQYITPGTTLVHSVYISLL